MLITILISVFIGAFIGFCGMAILSGGAYEKGFRDASIPFEKAHEDGKREAEHG
jgi:hypothetical protein